MVTHNMNYALLCCFLYIAVLQVSGQRFQRPCFARDLLTCWISPCYFQRCRYYPEATCTSLSMECGCRAAWIVNDREVHCDTPRWNGPLIPSVTLSGCPPGIARVQCFQNPCEIAVCQDYPSAVCRPNYCGGCLAEFFVNGLRIHCGSSKSIFSELIQSVNQHETDTAAIVGNDRNTGSSLAIGTTQITQGRNVLEFPTTTMGGSRRRPSFRRPSRRPRIGNFFSTRSEKIPVESNPIQRPDVTPGVTVGSGNPNDSRPQRVNSGSAFFGRKISTNNIGSTVRNSDLFQPNESGPIIPNTGVIPKIHASPRVNPIVNPSASTSDIISVPGVEVNPNTLEPLPAGPIVGGGNSPDSRSTAGRVGPNGSGKMNGPDTTNVDIIIGMSSSCPAGTQVANCKEDPCQDTCGVAGAVCRPSRCTSCHAQWFFDNKPITCSPGCLPTQMRVPCVKNPCELFTCDAFPSAVCKMSECGSCSHKWFVRGNEVNCDTVSTTEVCPLDNPPTRKCWYDRCPTDIEAKCRVIGCGSDSIVEYYKMVNNVVQIINCPAPGVWRRM